jgi:type I restriction enzyme, S subunit
MNRVVSDLIYEVIETKPQSDATVLSVSEGRGIVPQTDLFKRVIATEDRSKYRRVQYGDIVYNPYLLWNGAVGVCFLQDGGCVSPAYKVLRPHIQGTERFLHYFFRSYTFTTTVDGIASGSVTRRRVAPLDDVLALEFALPDFEDQKTASSLLELLAGKIELNRQMNETLEAIARAVFKSWFVDFDPVRDRADGRVPVGMSREIAELFPDAFEDSALGPIPQGWAVASLSDRIEVNPKRSLKKGTVAAYLDMKNMPTQGHYPNDVYPREFGSGTRFMNGDTLVARITPCLENGKTAYVDCLSSGEIGWGSTEYIVLRPTQALPTLFAYLLARSEDFRSFAIQSMTGSSGRQRVQIDSLRTYQLVFPVEAVAKSFGKTVGPLFVKVRANCEESATLAKIRDTLLPKLLSGEIRIKDAEKIVGEAT